MGAVDRSDFTTDAMVRAANFVILSMMVRLAFRGAGIRQGEARGNAGYEGQDRSRDGRQVLHGQAHPLRESSNGGSPRLRG